VAYPLVIALDPLGAQPLILIKEFKCLPWYRSSQTASYELIMGEDIKTISITDLSPTQVTVGMREVDVKRGSGNRCAQAARYCSILSGPRSLRANCPMPTRAGSVGAAACSTASISSSVRAIGVDMAGASLTGNSLFGACHRGRRVGFVDRDSEREHFPAQRDFVRPVAPAVGQAGRSR
jgi:hypothetical protein